MDTAAERAAPPLCTVKPTLTTPPARPQRGAGPRPPGPGQESSKSLKTKRAPGVMPQPNGNLGRFPSQTIVYSGETLQHPLCCWW